MNFIFCKFRKNSNTIPLNAVVFIKKSIFCYKFETRILNCTGKWGGMSKKTIFGETHHHPFYALSKHFSTQHFFNSKFMYCES